MPFPGKHISHVNFTQLTSDMCFETLLNRYEQDEQDFQTALTYFNQRGNSRERAVMLQILDTFAVATSWPTIDFQHDSELREYLKLTPVLFANITAYRDQRYRQPAEMILKVSSGKDMLKVSSNVLSVTPARKAFEINDPQRERIEIKTLDWKTQLKELTADLSKHVFGRSDKLLTAVSTAPYQHYMPLELV